MSKNVTRDFPITFAVVVTLIFTISKRNIIRKKKYFESGFDNTAYKKKKK